MLGLILSNMFLFLLPMNPLSWYLKIWALALISLLSLLHLFTPFWGYESLNWLMTTDSMSLFLVTLTFWISLMMMMASQNNVKIFNNNQQLFSSLLLILNLILIVAFSLSSAMYFYFFFEASLIPTLLLILGWGYQPERLQAGMYMMIYTVAASLPLLLTILWSLHKVCSSNMLMIAMLRNAFFSSELAWTSSLLTALVLMAFLVKLPMFTVHLWLPKAHVEAPVAGSMILAAILLKLGGYGILRMFQYFNFYMSLFTVLIFSVALWGGMLTSIICFRQVDLKALIAYSSVGHMSLMLAGVFSNSTWGWGGALVLMISHAFCSSALFALANFSYEKTHSRSLFLSKGMLMFLPSLSLWWFLFSAMNMAAPPSINLLGEVFIFPSIMFSSAYYALPLGLMSFLAALYSMYLFTSTQHGGSPPYMNAFSVFKTPGLTLLFLHWFPANLLIVKSELVFMWN